MTYKLVKPRDKQIVTLGLDRYNRLNTQWPPYQNNVSIKKLNKSDNKYTCTIGLNKYNRLKIQWPPK